MQYTDIKSTKSILLSCYTFREVLRNTLLLKRCDIHERPALKGYKRICNECTLGLRPFYQACLFCAKLDLAGKSCSNCKKRNIVSYSHSLVRLNDIGRSILWQSKFYGNIEYLDDLLILNKKTIESLILHYKSLGYIFICVPEAGDSLRRRGYHHNQYLRRYLWRRYRLLISNILAVSKHERQTGKTREQRMTSNNKVFLRRPLSTNKIVIVDDVFTTGQTVQSIAKVLYRHGAKDIVAISVFRK